MFSVFAYPNINTRGCWENLKQDIPVTIENSTTPSSVYIRLCIHSKKVFYCVYKNNFPDKKKQNSLFMALIKREILTHKVL